MNDKWDGPIKRDESLAHWAGRAVVVGLIIEVALAVAFRHGKSDVENFGPVVADVLVALGVYLELHFNGRASEKQKDRQRESQERLAAVNERAAILEKEAQEARLKTEEIKARVSWRTISGNDMQNLIAALAAGGGAVTLAYVQNDPEAIYLATLFSSAFNAANRYDPEGPWKISAQPRMYSDRNIFGVSVFGAAPDTVELVRQAFDSVNFAYETERVSVAPTRIGGMITPMDDPQTDVVVMIGSKLPGF